MKRNKTADFLKPGIIPNKSKLKLKEGVWAWALLSPTLILFIVFTLIPLVMAMCLSFTEFGIFDDIAADGLNGNGVENYEIIFDRDGVIGKDFWHTIQNVLIFVLMSVPMNVVGSLLIANLVNTKLKGVKFYRFIYYLPAITSGVATAFCWKWMLNYNSGLINVLIESMGGDKVDWLGTYSYLPMFSIAIISTWGALGGNMLIYLAALKGINPDLYEAADLDGANAFKKFLYITMPAVRPTTFFIVTMSLIGASQLFDTVWFVTSGSMAYTQTPVIMIYNLAFLSTGKGGLASAMSVILFLIIMCVTFVVQKLMKEKD